MRNAIGFLALGTNTDILGVHVDVGYILPRRPQYIPLTETDVEQDQNEPHVNYRTLNTQLAHLSR